MSAQSSKKGRQSSSKFSNRVTWRGRNIRLANVELQLIMQYMESHEIFQLARCSSQMMRAAESPFAWKFTLLRLTSSQLTARLELHSSPRLLVHIPLSLDFRFGLFYNHVPLQDDHLTLLQRCPYSLVELNLSRIVACNRSNKWLDIFACASVRQIRSLHIRFSILDVDIELLHQIIVLPYLHTLRVSDRLLDSSAWSLLTSAPCLTALHFVDSKLMKGNNHSSGLSYLMPLTGIRHLSVRKPTLSGLDFLAVFTSPLMSQLRTLELRSFQPIPQDGRLPISAEDYANSFAALIHLHSIDLCRIVGIDLMLPHLARAPSLRLLMIEPEWTELSCPSLPIFTQLMMDIPKLNVIIQFETRSQLKDSPAGKAIATFIGFDDRLKMKVIGTTQYTLFPVALR